VNNIDDWPKGLSEEVALLNATVEFFEKEFDIIFNNRYDDLDNYRYYIFNFERGSCAVMRYDNTPTTGVTLIIARECLYNAEEMIDYFVGCLHLSGDDIIWRR
jgi:hypothetical protein